MEVLNLEELPTWPLPPPSPPGLPPYPPPNRQLNASSHLECNFEPGTDLTITTPDAGQGAQHLTDTRIQCCALCAMRRTCRNFIFMPGSRICALLPIVPAEQIARVQNPGTVAGTVFVSHAHTQDAVVQHAKCSYEVGHAYSQGFLGQAQPPAGNQRITSQQARILMESVQSHHPPDQICHPSYDLSGRHAVTPVIARVTVRSSSTRSLAVSARYTYRMRSNTTRQG